jgi:hypothetical protein
MSDVDQGPSDDELFNEAVSDETPDTPVVTEEAEQPARDESGRFAKKEEPETAEVVAETPVEKPVVDDNASQVPSWRVREINEEKRAHLPSWKPCGPSVPNGNSGSSSPSRAG